MKQEGYTIPQTAEALSLGTSYIYRLIKKGKLEATYGQKVPSPILITHDSIMDYLGNRYPVLAANDNVAVEAEENV